MKKLILVTSPPACGKTYISKQLSMNLNHVVYLDKDSLIDLSKIIFEVAHQEYNRSSEFFETYIRNPEYEVIVNQAIEALAYDNIVLINAPFTREVKDISYMQKLKERLAPYHAELVVIWVDTDVEVCHQRMIDRASDRDTWKLEHWDEYIKTRDFNMPEELKTPGVVDELLIFNNSSEAEFKESMDRIVRQLESN